MKLWLLQFCFPEMTFESLRIAAPSRISAIMQAQAVSPGVQMIACEKGPIALGVFCSYVGEMASVTEPAILSAIPRRGKYAGKHIVRQTIHGNTQWAPLQ